MRNGRRWVVAFVMAVGVAALAGWGTWTALDPEDITRPATAAYTDGFEVVLIPSAGGPTAEAPRTLLLQEAEAMLAQGAGWTARLPPDTASIAAMLRSQNTGRSLVGVDLETAPAPGGAQQVSLSFHYGNRSEAYVYETNGQTLRPLGSRSSDLGGSQQVKYRPAPRQATPRLENRP